MRKRSGHVGFSALTLAAVALAGCGRQQDAARVYTSVDQCRAEQPAQACDAAWQASVGEHDATAPKFSDKAQCEAQYGVGHCETRQSDHGGFFMPMMAGFMIGQMMNRPYGQSAYVGHPVFFAPGGGFRAPSVAPGEAMFTRGGGVTARGGFGASAASHGFGGGGE
jgi:uncharacterized protein YgiB involved in biofilm formation